MALTPGWSGSKTIALKRLVNHILPFKTIIMVSQGSICCQEFFQSFYIRGYPPPYFAFLRCHANRRTQGRRGNRMPICLHTFFCTGLIDRQEKLKQRPQQQQRQKQLRYYLFLSILEQHVLFLFVNNYCPFCALDIFYLMRYGIDTDYGPQRDNDCT